MRGKDFDDLLLISVFENKPTSLAQGLLFWMRGHNDRHANGRGTGSVRDLLAGKFLSLAERAECVTATRARKAFALSGRINAAKPGTTK